MEPIHTRIHARFGIEDQFRVRCLESIQRLRREDFVGRSAADIVAHTMELHRLEPPVLGAWIKQDRQAWVHGVLRYDYLLCARLESGDRRWFEVGGLGGRSVECFWDGATREIVLKAERPGDAPKELKEKAEEVGRNLALYAEEVRRIEERVKEGLTAEVEKACRRSLEATDVMESIPYPLSRTDPGAMGLLVTGGQSPLGMATVPPRIPTAKPLMGPGLVDAHRLRLEERAYFEVIDACMSMGNTIKRNPSTFKRFWSGAQQESVQETPFRDVLLLGLNATFKGQATGETFNGRGKTDILLRVQDRDLFIAECKVWRGEKSYVDAIKQLLDRYVTWDLLRVAVIMFVGSKDFTKVLKTFAEATARHEYCERVDQELHEGQQIRWSARHPSDLGRKDLTITSIAMHVPNVSEEVE